MTKAELFSKVSMATGVTTADVREVVEATVVEIKKSVASGDGVFYRGFGTFERKTRKQKIGRNIGKGIALVVPEHDIPFFKPSPEFAQAVK